MFDVAYIMAEEVEYRCFIGGLSWSTSDRGLKEAFEKFGHLLEAKVSTMMVLIFSCVIRFLLDRYCFLCGDLHIVFLLPSDKGM